jgi:hypothetical protein
MGFEPGRGEIGFKRELFLRCKRAKEQKKYKKDAEKEINVRCYSTDV